MSSCHYLCCHVREPFLKLILRPQEQLEMTRIALFICLSLFKCVCEWQGGGVLIFFFLTSKSIYMAERKRVSLSPIFPSQFSYFKCFPPQSGLLRQSSPAREKSGKKWLEKGLVQPCSLLMKNVSIITS